MDAQAIQTSLHHQSQPKGQKASSSKSNKRKKPSKDKKGDELDENDEDEDDAEDQRTSDNAESVAQPRGGTRSSTRALVAHTSTEVVMIRPNIY